MPKHLTVTNHDRDSADLTYVYPVVSRRARGVSIGINLNPDNTCNFRCIYCQVPDLVLGNGPLIDLERLATELRGMLADVLHGSFMQERVPAESRRLNDIAFSGNGEPTTSPNFAEAARLVIDIRDEFELRGQLPVIVITNGSRTDRPSVEASLKYLGQTGGRIWFKLDAASQQRAEVVNDSRAPLPARIERLRKVAHICPTWIQSCFFALDGKPPDAPEVDAYVELLAGLKRDLVPVRGVLLYGVARPSLQPESPRLSNLEAQWFSILASRVEALGLDVQVSL
jgi:wyosine [tRNA(Phe)-imidazoG37] synthetase (radical SAM superfamily)